LFVLQQILIHNTFKILFSITFYRQETSLTSPSENWRATFVAVKKQSLKWSETKLSWVRVSRSFKKII
jgi:hypothetical protein